MISTHVRLLLKAEALQIYEGFESLTNNVFKYVNMCKAEKMWTLVKTLLDFKIRL